MLTMADTVQLTAADGFALPAYVARPTGTPKAAVVVLQEIFGVNVHIRQVADVYAAAGYLAVAPATFHRVKPGVDLGYTMDDMGAGMALKAAVEALSPPGVLQDIRAAVDYAAAALGAGGKVGVVGYCWGGLLTWRSACLLSGISAAVPYYGGGMTVGTEPARSARCPVLCHFGELDKHISQDSVAAFKAGQSGKTPPVAVQVYAADHGFNCDHRGSYDPAAAELARTRTLAFFAKHLG